MLCFSDISQRILYDTSKAEGELLSLINSTISHEMRNPLNSVINQCKIIYAMCMTFNQVLTEGVSDMPVIIFDQLKDVYDEVLKSVNIMSSSSQLLLLNVEDILGFAQLKAGKFVKIIKRFNIKRAIEDIVSIQQYQAESKNIQIQTKFLGFPPRNLQKIYPDGEEIPISEQNLMIESDEKRIKQVLINLQSNALKFTKETGVIQIVTEFIYPKGSSKKRCNHSQFYQSFSSEEHNSESDLGSEADNFEHEHLVSSIYDPIKDYPKLVISVIDTGIGIKKKDKIKLFKLFGCLQNTRQMNT